MTNNYYDRDKHGYMRYPDDRFADYIYSLIADDSFLNYKTAIEFGAGMGRFSASVIKHFSKTTLVEPVPAYTDILKKKFPNNCVRILTCSVEEFLSTRTSYEPALFFCFHLMHHLTYGQRKIIYHHIKKTDSKCVLVEPNPLNPLLLIQLAIYPDMSFSQEKQYLSLTKRRYKKEIENAGLSLTSFKRICFLPPFILNIILKRFSNHFITSFERLNKIVPFLSSYQLITFENNG
ncbi:MAG: hypothetical protein DRH04_10175 [Deltaproteobacteria bacterium]|nr:MAG: hypothetical protein DRH04_10175 [Deltaproteobacteria bacterium]